MLLNRRQSLANGLPAGGEPCGRAGPLPITSSIRMSPAAAITSTIAGNVVALSGSKCREESRLKYEGIKTRASSQPASITRSHQAAMVVCRCNRESSYRDLLKDRAPRYGATEGALTIVSTQ